MTTVQEIKEKILQLCKECADEENDIYSDHILNLATAYKMFCESESMEIRAAGNNIFYDQIKNYMMRKPDSETAKEVIKIPDRFNNL